MLANGRMLRVDAGIEAAVLQRLVGVPAGPEGPRIHEAACWTHVRRKFFDIHTANASPLAAEALKRIGALYDFEARIRGRPPDARRRVRAAEAAPQLSALKTWLENQLRRVPGKSTLAGVIRYALSRWTALTLYVEDGTGVGRQQRRRAGPAFGRGSSFRPELIEPIS